MLEQSNTEISHSAPFFIHLSFVYPGCDFSVAQSLVDPGCELSIVQDLVHFAYESKVVRILNNILLLPPC